MLRLPESVRSVLAAWAHEGYPHETCGLLVGRSLEHAPEHVHAEHVEVVRAVRARNLNQSRARDRYELDPADFVAADAAARNDDLEVVGIWHSHPDHPAQPSETDRAAAWPGWSYVIVQVDSSGIGDLRSWRLTNAHFEEETVERS